MNTISTAITQLLGHLTDRQKAVIVRRFGLEGKEPQTLATIGESFGITRERVRQIEAGSITSLRSDFSDDKNLTTFVVSLVKLLQSLGGVIRSEDFVKVCNETQGALSAPHLIFLARVSGQFHFSSENDEYHAFFYLDEKTLKRAAQTVSKLVKFMKAKQSQVAAGRSRDVLELFVQNEDLESDFVERCVAISKLFHVNAFGDFGLAEWPEIRPQTIRDRIYLILKKQQKPMHFREIAQAINGAGLSRKVALVPTVHNELIKDQRFILVGRGMYALEEHGYKPGTAREVIVRILKQHGPLSGEEIVMAVQKERFFKPNTVIANLQNKKNFSRRSDGLYHIREA